MRMRCRPAMFAVMASLALIPGCAVLLLGTGAAVGAGAVAYVRGELKSTEETTLAHAVEAARIALADLGFQVAEVNSTTTITVSAGAVAPLPLKKEAVRIESRSPDGRKIIVSLEQIRAGTTDIGIRVGTFGDESLSRRILEKIKARL